uniref:C9orf66 protein n=1 Tax=Homo sapiens TaxID=9606 RepID=Q0VG94_HUMAN|nr:C9orf66 protein [Homo sapiens]
MRHSVARPTRLPRRLSPFWDPATCKNLEGGAGEVVRGRDPRRLRTSRSTEILGEDLAGPSAGAAARPARLPGNVGKSGEPHKAGEVGNHPRDS